MLITVVREKIIGRLFFLILLAAAMACGVAGEPLPTLVPTAALPTATPAPTATFPVHQSVRDLVRGVTGSRLASMDYEQYTEYRGEPYPDGRVGYHIDLSIASPSLRTRTEMLELAYMILHEFYYNYGESNLMFVSASLRSQPDDIACVFGLGIGYRAIDRYLPVARPADLNVWFSDLVESKYYGDLPGETEALLAYGNDPQNVPLCELEQWKR